MSESSDTVGMGHAAGGAGAVRVHATSETGKMGGAGKARERAEAGEAEGTRVMRSSGESREAGETGNERKPRDPDVTRWKCVCAYDGAAFEGWQSQVGGNAIQDVIEARLAQIFKTQVRIHGSGRTDAGVHAHGQVFHFDAVWRHDPAKLLAAFRVGLPPQIQVKSVRAVSPEFHARFGAKGKRYIYHLHLGDADPFTRPYAWAIFKPLDFDAMEEAAAILRGRHDFRAFTALNGPEREDTVRELRRLDIVRKGRRVAITAESEGFLYKMVRSLVGGLVAVGDGRQTPAQLKAILEKRERTAAVQTAPPQGLFLMKVFY